MLVRWDQTKSESTSFQIVPEVRSCTRPQPVCDPGAAEADASHGAASHKSRISARSVKNCGRKTTRREVIVSLLPDSWRSNALRNR